MNIERGIQSELDNQMSYAFQSGQSRRTLMQRALAVGGAAGLAYVLPRAVMVQDATPEGGGDSPGAHIPAGNRLELVEEQVIRLGMTEPKCMNPGVSTGYDELGNVVNIFDGLAGVDMATGEVVPCCADSWGVYEDATEYTFHVDLNLMWSNGEPIAAADFEYFWKQVSAISVWE